MLLLSGLREEGELKMSNHKVDVTVLVDRSGSMFGIRRDTIEGLNTFITEQQKDPDGQKMTYIQFDNEYEVVHDDIPVSDMPLITEATFVPRGMTALLDAIGQTINRIDSKLAVLNDDEKPERVMVVIVTDGHENASKNFSRDAILEMVKGHEDSGSWEFIYLGANQDAIRVGGGIGVRSTHAHTYTAGTVGVKHAFSNSSNAVYRAKKLGQRFRGFSDTERAVAMGDAASASQVKELEKKLSYERSVEKKEIQEALDKKKS